MAELLPGKARYKTIVIESPQAVLAHSKKEGLSHAYSPHAWG